MPTGVVPSAIAVSAEPWPRVTTFFGSSGISAVPSLLLMETGNAPSLLAEALGLPSSEEEEQPPRTTTSAVAAAEAATPCGAPGRTAMTWTFPQV